MVVPKCVFNLIRICSSIIVESCTVFDATVADFNLRPETYVTCYKFDESGT